MKRIIASLLAGLCLLALVGCSAGSKADSASPKDYSQIIHDARTDEDNEYDMIFTKGEDGKFTAIDGYSAEYEADQLNDELKDIVFPLLGLEDGSYESFAASVSSMMVRSYAVAIVKPAEGKTDAVKAALEAYVQSEQQSMEHYLEDQYLVAKAATGCQRLPQHHNHSCVNRGRSRILPGCGFFLCADMLYCSRELALKYRSIYV